MGGRKTTAATEKILMMPFCSIEIRPSTASSRKLILPDRKVAWSVSETISRCRILMRALFSFTCLFSRVWSSIACMKAIARPMDTRLSRILETKSPSSPIFSISSCRLTLLRGFCLCTPASVRLAPKVFFEVSSTICPARSKWSAARSTTASSSEMRIPQPFIVVACGFIARFT